MPAAFSHDLTLLPAVSTGFGAMIGNTSSAPGADSSRRTHPTSGPRPPLLMRINRWT
jgi:hypothetical protein